jgi:hypothetical protein
VALHQLPSLQRKRQKQVAERESVAAPPTLRRQGQPCANRPADLWRRNQPIEGPATLVWTSSRRNAPGSSRGHAEGVDHLLAACYIVIAYLTGARDSEVQGLERGCHFTEPSDDGVLVRHKIRGWTTKRRGGSPKRAAWVALDDVARAVDVLERLTPEQSLFTRPNRTPVRVLTAPRRPKPGGSPPASSGARWLAHRPSAFGPGRRQNSVPADICRGFRRLRGHQRIRFRAEVEKERAEAQLDDLVERYEDDLRGVMDSVRSHIPRC